MHTTQLLASEIKSTIKRMKTIQNKNVALGYCRVSTDDQADNGISLDYQAEQCKNAAKRDGFQEITIISDEGKSGKSLNRKGIQRVIELARKREIIAIYVTHSDRLARNIVDHSFLRTTFTSNGVALKYLNGQSSAEDASAILADNMFATINQYHSDITREKTKQAVENKVKAGYFPTCAPVGYLNCDNPDKNCERVAKKIIVPHPKTGQLVTEAFKMYARGQYNALQVNDLMHEKGLVTGAGKKLAPSIVYKMFRNRIYLGEIRWKSVHIKRGKHQPLTDQNTFNRVQHVMSENNANGSRRRKFFWLLNGFVFCPTHKRRYTAEWHLNKSKAYYHCSNHTGCGKYIEKSDLEQQVAEKFKNLQFDPSFVNLIIKKVRAIFEERKNKYYAEHRGLLNQKNAWEAKLKSAEDLLLDETLSREDYKRIKNDATLGIDKLEQQISKLKKNHDINIDITSEIFNFTKNIYTTYMRSPEQLQKKFIGFFFEGFDVKNGIIINDRYSPLFQELIHLNALSVNMVNNQKTFGNNAETNVILETLKGA